eukprot:CAMPEP_0195135310 /NCGR_PEP_ID=MMETSP0448-20130528/152212_1 /TAXON_ID=66468 /ORGANISM="Heterocapsa triquestra, Strain CCMP 448" /LENGTH=112 /DNA_ID=CAMNT_0040173441 /DNA_START=117 /DNA_END=452 /DNA_ORIENTATION=-
MSARVSSSLSIFLARSHVNCVKRSLSMARSHDAAADDEDEEWEWSERVEDGAECCMGRSSGYGLHGISFRMICLCFVCSIMCLSSWPSERPGLLSQGVEAPEAEDKSPSSSL